MQDPIVRLLDHAYGAALLVEPMSAACSDRYGVADLRLPLARCDDIMSTSVGHNSDEGVPTMLSFLRRQTESPRIGQIRLLNLFATLNQRELRIIDDLLHDRHYLKDEVVFDHGEEGQALYVVLSGRVLICRQGQPLTGRIAEIPAGALFGELALLDGAPRVAQARAAEDCVLAALSRADFTRLVETHGRVASKIALQLARDLGQKLVAVNAAMETRPL